MEKTLLFKGKKIAYYATQGKGQTVVLLHGFPMDKRVWNGLLPGLQQDFNVIAIDLPGFGASEMVQEDLQMDLFAAVVKEVLEKENVEHCVLAGHSMGGYAALAFAAEYPKMLRGLILLHSHALADDPQSKLNRQKAIDAVQANQFVFVESFIEGLFEGGFAIKNQHIVNHYIDIAASQKTEAIVGGLMGLRDRKSQLATLSNLSCPVLFILGKTDSRMPFAGILAQVALPAHAELLLLDKVGHMGFAEAGEKIQHAIAAFVKRSI